MLPSFYADKASRMHSKMLARIWPSQPQTTDTAAKLDRDADLLLSVGRHYQAERLSHRAQELRQEVVS